MSSILTVQLDESF